MSGASSAMKLIGIIATIGLLLAGGCLDDFASEDQIQAKLNAGDGFDGAVGDTDAEDAPVEATVSADTAIDAATDAAIDSADADTADVPDAVDTAPDATPLTCPAAPGCKCSQDTTCASGACINLECAEPCSAGGACPASFNCAAYTNDAKKSVQVCVERWLTACDPCKSNQDCSHLGDPAAACIDLGPPGNFCAPSCTVDADCPGGYECKDRKTTAGEARKACVRKPGAGQTEPGACTCSALAKIKKAATACYVESKDAGGKLIGACKGSRACESQGLSECSAAKPTAEICDGKDNDCDNYVDVGACEDQNPCTADACSLAGTPTCTHAPIDGAACDDGQKCTSDDACKFAKCGGKPMVCKGSACIDSACDPSVGKCVPGAKPDGSTCDDGNACSSGDVCSGGGCQGKPVLCDDKQGCTSDSCDPAKGCLFTPTSAFCDDGNKCTTGDQCDKGLCTGVPKAAAECDDKNPCTQDVCDPAKDCSHTPTTAVCDDGNPCTSGEKCDSGACKGGVSSCGCQTDADCAKKDDADKCNGFLVCDPTKKDCVTKEGSVIICPAATTCYDFQCQKATGVCEPQPINEGKPCADESACTDGDSCKGGACAPGPALDCNDSNPCTDDACDAKAGCTHANSSNSCNDGDACTKGDTCKGGVCAPGGGTTCIGGGPCALAACDPKTGACVTTPTSGNCDDGNACTIGDTCVSGKCQSGAPLQCNDNSACTTDACQGGNCQFAPKNCDDGNACTTDGCSATTGCTHTEVACASTSGCETGTCNPQTGTCEFKSKCDDANPCTLDSCASSGGKCSNQPLSDGTQCGATGSNKVCASGKCFKQWAILIAAGGDTTCAVRTEGTVFCWGHNGSGQIGDGSMGGERLVPTQVKGLQGVYADSTTAQVLAVGSQFACAIANWGDKTFCWGNNTLGQLGDGTGLQSSAPVEVKAPAGVKFTRIAAGGSHVCAIASDKKLYCWGSNDKGQLGLGNTTDHKTPQHVSKLTAPVAGVGAGKVHTCATSSQFLCWGSNEQGQLAQNKVAVKSSSSPSAVTGLPQPVQSFAAGGWHTCAAGGSGSGAKVVCWGLDDNGQLGDGDAIIDLNSNPIRTVKGLPDGLPSGLANGAWHSHAYYSNADEPVFTWGRGDKGQIGAGVPESAVTAFAAKIQPSVRVMAAGNLHSCARKADGSVWCWGDNAVGQCGLNNKTTPQKVPVQVFGTAPTP
jgi:alpha-tubulin suppressor-like RCC1 family protein